MGKFTSNQNAAGPSMSPSHAFVLKTTYLFLGGSAWIDQTGWTIYPIKCDAIGVICNANGEVTSLTLKGNNLQGNLYYVLWSNLNTLTYLNLADNYLFGPIPSTIGNIPSLLNLNLRNNQLTYAIPDSIYASNSLQHLQLDQNQLTGNLNFVPTGSTALIFLELSNNSLLGPLTGILSCVNIKTILLGNNGFTGSIPPELFQMAQLAILSLNDNDLTGTLPSSFGFSDTLTQLDLSNNQLTGTLSPFLSSLTLSSPIQSLLLKNNNFSGNIPSSVFQLPQLQTFNIQNNMLTSLKINQLLPSDTTALITIDVSFNNFSGPFPPLNTLRQLQVLRLSDNSFTGAIPSLPSTIILLNAVNNAFTYCSITPSSSQLKTCTLNSGVDLRNCPTGCTSDPLPPNPAPSSPSPTPPTSSLPRSPPSSAKSSPLSTLPTRSSVPYSLSVFSAIVPTTVLVNPNPTTKTLSPVIAPTLRSLILTTFPSRATRSTIPILQAYSVNSNPLALTSPLALILMIGIPTFILSLLVVFIYYKKKSSGGDPNSKEKKSRMGSSKTSSLNLMSHSGKSASNLLSESSGGLDLVRSPMSNGPLSPVENFKSPGYNLVHTFSLPKGPPITHSNSSKNTISNPSFRRPIAPPTLSLNSNSGFRSPPSSNIAYQVSLTGKRGMTGLAQANTFGPKLILSDLKSPTTPRENFKSPTTSEGPILLGRNSEATSLSTRMKKITTTFTIVNAKPVLCLPGHLKAEWSEISLESVLVEKKTCEIWIGTYTKSGGSATEKVVVKKVVGSDVDGDRLFLQEVAVTSTLSGHPSIVAMLGWTDSPCSLLLHQYPTTLDSILTDLTITLPLDDTLFPIAQGIRFIHDQFLAHQDLKSSNIFVDFDSHGKIHPVIGDFGISIMLDSQVSIHAIKNILQFGFSAGYASPEVLNGTVQGILSNPESLPMSSFPLVQSQDLYAFAIIAWETMNRSHVWPGMEAAPLFQKVLSGERPPWSLAILEDLKLNSLASVIEECWQESVSLRLTSEELCIRLNSFGPDYF